MKEKPHFVLNWDTDLVHQISLPADCTWYQARTIGWSMKQHYNGVHLLHYTPGEGYIDINLSYQPLTPRSES